MPPKNRDGQVISINNISFTSECRGVLNSTRFVNVSVTLHDDTVLLNTYNGNNSLYPGLLDFNLTDNTSASIEGNTLTLLGNSDDKHNHFFCNYLV